MMTRRFHVALILATAAVAVAACEQTATTPQSAGQAPATPESSKVDATFIGTAGTLGLAEVKLGQLAATTTTDPAVRDFAAKILADLPKVNQQLAVLAQNQGMTPPSDMDGHHQALYSQLQSLTGPAFDRAYMGGRLQDLTMAIQAFQSEADSGAIPQIRAFAQQHLPMMQQHLQLALAEPAAQ